VGLSAHLCAECFTAAGHGVARPEALGYNPAWAMLSVRIERQLRLVTVTFWIYIP